MPFQKRRTVIEASNNGEDQLCEDGPLCGLDIELKKVREKKYDLDLETELRGWIEQVTGRVIGKNFQAGLKDGQILCQLMNCIYPNAIKKIYKGEQVFPQMDNIVKFLDCCRKKLKLREIDMFTTNDLYRNSGMDQVLMTLRAVQNRTTDAEDKAPEVTEDDVPDVDENKHDNGPSEISEPEPRMPVITSRSAETRIKKPEAMKTIHQHGESEEKCESHQVRTQAASFAQQEYEQSALMLETNRLLEEAAAEEFNAETFKCQDTGRTSMYEKLADLDPRTEADTEISHSIDAKGSVLRKRAPREIDTFF